MDLGLDPVEAGISGKGRRPNAKKCVWTSLFAAFYVALGSSQRLRLEVKVKVKVQSQMTGA